MKEEKTTNAKPEGEVLPGSKTEDDKSGAIPPGNVSPTQQAQGGNSGEVSTPSLADTLDNSYRFRKRADGSGERQREPWVEFFEAARIEMDTFGERCEFPDLETAKERFEHGRRLVVVGAEVEKCKWVATIIARTHQYRCYYSDLPKFTVIDDKVLVKEARLRQDPSCVIRNHIEKSWFSIENFARETHQLFDGNAAIIVFIHPITWRKLQPHWPSGMHPVVLPERPTTFGAANPTLTPDEQIRRLFEPEIEGTIPSMEAIAATARQLLIQRILVRLGVLFPRLSATSFKRLLEAGLKDVEIEVSPATKDKDADKRPAIKWWTDNAPILERMAGLERRSSGGVPLVCFNSTEMEAAAQAWAWRYPEELFSLFSAISRQGILFSEDWTDEQKVLLQRYILAVADLAARAPGLFDAQWLETVLHDYAKWVGNRTPECDLEATNIYEYLAQIASSNLRWELWNHFAERIALVGKALYLNRSASILDQFFGRLIQCKLPQLLLKIMRCMDDSLTPEIRAKWFERIIRESDLENRVAAVRELALHISWRPQYAPSFLKIFKQWSNPAAGRRITELGGAAMAIPACLFGELAEQQSDAPDDEYPLVKLLAASDEESGTLLDFCEKVMAHPEFADYAAIYLNLSHLEQSEQPFAALALVLYWCALGLPDSEFKIASRLATAALGWRKYSERGRVSRWWKHIADVCSNAKQRIPRYGSPSQERERAEWSRSYDVVKTLMRN